VATENRGFFSTDNGATWTEKFSPNSNVFDATNVFQSTYEGDKIIIGGSNTDPLQPNLFISDDYGDTWSELIVDGITAARTNWAVAIEGDTIIATSESPTLINKISKDGGTTWSDIVGIASSRTIKSAWISEDENTIIAHANINNSSDFALFLSNDGGLSFSSITIPRASNMIVIGAADKSRVFLAVKGTATTTNFFFTENLGTSWTSVNASVSLSRAWDTAACSKDGKNILVGEINRAYLSTNYGVSFAETFPTGVASNRQYRASVIKTNPIYKASTPTFSPSLPLVLAGDIVTLSVPVSGSTIRYTNNGTEPTSSSILYGGGIAITSDVTLKAKSFKSSYVDSDTATQAYQVIQDVWALSSGSADTMSYNRTTFSNSGYSSSFNVVIIFKIKQGEVFSRR
jgi:photosystem II stability/assembly factor-like uncharacterized protein